MALWRAVDRSSALIEFDLNGIILRANSNFLRLFGYTENELIGCHHSMLVAPGEADSESYSRFWSSLRKGEFMAGEFMRISRDGTAIWLQASYNPVLSSQGKPERVIKVATDITRSKNQSVADAGKIEAIERSMAVVEFLPDGTILRANPIFLDLMGYSEAEIVGRKHSMFVDKEEASLPAYKRFWASLADGQFQRGQFKRITKAGDAVWLEAAYNPIFDATGSLLKVVKFAYDVTEQFNQALAVLGEKSAQLEAALEEAREAERVRLELDRTLQEMSTPVTPIWDQILLLPLVGIVDSTRTDDVMRKTLDRISQTGSKMFILDISGVPTVDTAVANQLIKITKATRIMGCETFVSGVSSSIAHTIVELGVDISELRTTATLRDAFSTCLGEMGVLNLQSGKGAGASSAGFFQPWQRSMSRSMQSMRGYR
jgi:methyl-accepting chemotaxis protein